MRSIRSVILALCFICGVIALYLLNSRSHPQRTPGQGPPGSLQTSKAQAKTDGAIQDLRRQFSWRQIETDQYVDYIDNLRRIECPEPTVEDIVVADVNALYMDKAKAPLDELKQSLASYYITLVRSSAKESIVSAATAKLEILNSERLALISKLLNHEVEQFKSAGAPWVHALQEVLSNDYPYLSPDKANALRQLKADEKARLDARVPTGKGLNAEKMKFWEEMRRTTESEIAKILTPTEFQNYIANESVEAHEVRRKLNNVRVSESEFTQLLKASREFYDKYGYFYTSPELVGQRVADEHYFRTLLENLLGKDRYQEFLKQNDPAFQDVAAFAQSASLSSEQANQLYSLRMQVESEFRSIGVSQLSAEEKQQMKLDVVKRAEDRLNALVDDQKRSDYLKSDAGDWLNRIRTTGRVRNGTGSTTAILDRIQ